MKKIIKSIATASALTFALTSASAELVIKNQARIRTSAYSSTKPVEGDKSETLWNLKNSSAADYLDFYASNDYAGVSVEALIDSGNKAKTGAITFDTYYGWINYGDLKLSFGDFDSRFTNRFNVTATEAGLLDSDIAKYGLSNKLATGLKTTKGAVTTDVKYGTVSPGEGYAETGTGSGVWIKTTTEPDTYSVGTVGKTWLYDFGNTAQSAGGENLALLADYTFSDVGGGKLLLKGGLIEYDYDKRANFNQLAGYVFEAAWQSEKASLDLIFKNPANKAYGGGAYLTVKPIDSITTVFGFTGGTQDEIIDFAYAVDGRVNIALTDNLKATFVGKYSSLKAEEADDAETGIEAGGEISYIVNDTFTFALDARLDYVDLDDNDKSDLGENTVTISPRAKVSAGPAAAVTAALEFTQSLNAGDDYKDAVKTDIKVPVIFRVKL